MVILKLAFYVHLSRLHNRHLGGVDIPSYGLPGCFYHDRHRISKLTVCSKLVAEWYLCTFYVTVLDTHDQSDLLWSDRRKSRVSEYRTWHLGHVLVSAAGCARVRARKRVLVKRDGRVVHVE